MDKKEFVDKKEFGQRLRALMIAKGWTPAELARRAGMPRNNISTYINGRSFPNDLNLKSLARALGVAPDELLPGGARRVPADPPREGVTIIDEVTSHLRLDRDMPTERAMRIMAIATAE